MKIERQTRDTKGALQRLESIITRIENFSRRFNGTPSGLVEQAWHGFATRNASVGIWALLSDDGELVGHAIAGVIPWGSEWVGWLYQLESDTPAPRDAHDAFLADLEEWAREWNAVAPAHQRVSEIKFQTPHDPKVMARHSGFAFEATLMRRRLS